MAQYPGSTPTDQDLYVSTNNAQTFLTAGIDAVVTTIPVSDTSSFPADGVIGIGTEAIHYSSKDATNFLGCTRAFDSTTAIPHLLNDVVKGTVVATHHNSIKDEIIALATDLRAVFAGDLNDAVTPVAVATSIKNRLDHIATALSNITGVDWKTAPNDDINSIDGRVTSNNTEIDILKANTKNILYNGAFAKWQKGTPLNISAIPNLAMYADGWKRNFSVAPTTGTVSQETTIVQTPDSALKWDVTVLGAFTGGALFQSIEDFRFYRSKVLSVSVWIRTALSGVKISIFDGVSTFSSDHTGDDTWQKLTVTRTIGAGAAEVRLQITLPGVTGTIYIDDAWCNLGSTVLDFNHDEKSIEMTRVQRHYERFDDVLIKDHAGSTTNVVYTMPFATEKRATPTVTVNGGTTGNVSGVAAAAISTRGFGFSITPTAIGDWFISGGADAFWTAEV